MNGSQEIRFQLGLAVYMPAYVCVVSIYGCKRVTMSCVRFGDVSSVAKFIRAGANLDKVATAQLHNRIMSHIRTK